MPWPRCTCRESAPGRSRRIVQELCGLEVTSTQASRAAAELDEQLDAWRNRPIGEITYLVLDARYEKIRHDGAIRSCALLTAIGIDTDGKRGVLGCSVQLSEAEPHWRKFLDSLQKRGMHGVKLIVGDDHAGLSKMTRCAMGLGNKACSIRRCSTSGEGGIRTRGPAFDRTRL